MPRSRSSLPDAEVHRERSPDAAGSGLSGIVVSGARTHNLKNVSLTLPHDRLTVITGPSGSGKSSLALDTVFAESQRQYLETLSLFARQFVEQLPRPDVDSIEGLLPALRVDQQALVSQPRSTVGTLTEIHDYLRILYARTGEMRCPGCGDPIRQQTPEQIARWVLELAEGTKLILLAPLVRGRRGKHEEILERVRSERLVRVRVDGQLCDIDQVPALNPKQLHDVEAVTDRLVVRPGIESRLTESLDLALRLSGGTVIVSWPGEDANGVWQDRLFSTRNACARCERSFAELEPRSFSFNSPYGACPTCQGMGQSDRFEAEQILGLPSQGLNSGLVRVWKGWSKTALAKQLERLGPVLAVAKLTTDTPFAKWTTRQRELVWEGSTKPVASGLRALLESDFEETERAEYYDQLAAARIRATCDTCRGTRLNELARAVVLSKVSIDQLSSFPLEATRRWFAEQLQTDAAREAIAKPVIREIRSRLEFLCRVGLGYLTLDRPVETLSGGEHQRVRLASCIGAGLTNVCFVLDEPSMGLHARDTQRLVELLGELRDSGNTILVVEHDEAMMRAADWLVDMGPGAGRFGGEVVDQGAPPEVAGRALGSTGQYLARPERVDAARARQTPGDKVLRVRGATANNLRELDVDIPLGGLIGVCGVSGSGKSTLVHEVLVPAVRRQLGWTVSSGGSVDCVEGLESLQRLVNIDQRPIGRTPRGCPATYCGFFDEIRKTFAATKLAKQLGYGPQRFSFNSAAGWCPDCRGHGLKRVEMKFLPDLFVDCGTCRGARFNQQTLQVRFRDRTIAEVLQLSVAEACEEFAGLSRIHSGIEALREVGLGYLQLGQPSTTLSGGEAQRVKLAAELVTREGNNALYVLDEPTTGLHFEDVKRLLAVLRRLVDLGNTVLVIEHHLDVLAAADWLIELGPEGGASGGKVVAAGTPEQLSARNDSPTGRFLRATLGL
ncbi:MAG: excinuclease ABC subunit UvrA [Planctomycetota bacterium]